MEPTNKTILIIDDEKAYRQMFSNELKKVGYNVFEAEGGKEGLKMALDKKPDLILLDLGMPEMDGMTVLSELRKNEWGKVAKVFILTNLSDTTKLAEAMEHRSFVYLVKSDMTMEELVAKVRKQLEMKI